MDGVIGMIMENPVGTIITVAVIYLFIKSTFGNNNNDNEGNSGNSGGVRKFGKREGTGGSSAPPPSSPPPPTE